MGPGHPDTMTTTGRLDGAGSRLSILGPGPVRTVRPSGAVIYSGHRCEHAICKPSLSHPDPGNSSCSPRLLSPKPCRLPQQGPPGGSSRVAILMPSVPRHAFAKSALPSCGQRQAWHRSGGANTANSHTDLAPAGMVGAGYGVQGTSAEGCCREPTPPSLDDARFCPSTPLGQTLGEDMGSGPGAAQGESGLVRTRCPGTSSLPVETAKSDPDPCISFVWGVGPSLPIGAQGKGT